MGAVGRVAWRLVDRYRPKPVQRARAEVRRGVVAGQRLLGKAIDEADDRLGMAKFGHKMLNKIFPDHWSFFLGEIALYSFVVLVATGIFLTFYFVPSQSDLIYHGPYRALDGTKVSMAYNSVMNLSFTVKAGLFVRQLHHWAADVFIGAICVHMCRIFFTSAYRKPRDLNWVIGLTLLMLSILNGYLGYSLPDDLLSGTGVRIGYSILLSIPFIGSYLAFWIFGGNFPGHDTINRFYAFHVFFIPLLIIGLLSAHLALIVRQEHTQWPGEEKTPTNSVGSPMWPMFGAKTLGLFLMVAAGLSLLAGVVQIDPIWQYGSYEAFRQSTAAQPDWYMSWLEGALRLMPNWEFAGWGHTIVWAVFLPAVVLPALTFGIFYAWPFLERWVTGDRRYYQLVTPPRRRPVHTALGAGVFTFYFMLLFAGGDDVLSNFLHVSLPVMVMVLRITVFLLPIAVGLVTWKICRDLNEGPAGRRTRPSVTMTDGHFEASAPVPPPSESLSPIEVPDVVIGVTPGGDGSPRRPAEPAVDAVVRSRSESSPGP